MGPGLRTAQSPGLAGTAILRLMVKLGATTVMRRLRIPPDPTRHLHLHLSLAPPSRPALLAFLLLSSLSPPPRLAFNDQGPCFLTCRWTCILCILHLIDTCFSP